MTPRTLALHFHRPPRDVAEWLLGDTRTTVSPALDRAMDVPGDRAAARPLENLSRVARAALRQQIVIALRAVLHGDVADLLVAGWRKHHTLVEAANATLVGPGTEQLVTLAEHRVRWTQDPTLDVILDGVPVLTLSACLETLFDIGEVVAMVRSGRLVELRAGNAAVTGTVTVQDQEISRRTVQLPLQLVVDLGPGVALTTTRSPA